MNANSAIVENRRFGDVCLAALVLCSIVVGGFSLIFKPGAEGGSVFDLPYLIGPTAQSFLAGHGFQACSEAMGTEGNPICFSSARMPAATLEKLVGLANDGATILFLKNLPTDVPGLSDLNTQRAKFKALLGRINLDAAGANGIQSAKVGAGTILVGPDADALLTQAGVAREPMVDQGVWFVRRTGNGGLNYFIANRGAQNVDQWVTLAYPAKSAVLLDPRFTDHGGAAALRTTPDGATQIYLQLPPGDSRILKTFTAPVPTPAWPNYAAAGAAQALTGAWDVKFVDGGPALPAAFTTTTLGTWTDQADPEAKRFAGTASYTLNFDAPAGPADDWILDLGKVGDSARVAVNGRDVGHLFGGTMRVAVGKYLKPGKNTLEVDVTNIGANRVHDLDVRKVNWKYFYDANMNSKQGRGGFDASGWPLRASGLLGPVQLQPVKNLAL